MSLAALDAIDDAIDATRSMLWPFDLGKWARLAFVVFFLGGAGAVNPFQFTSNVGNVGTGEPSGTPTDPGQLPSVSEIINSLTPTEWAIIGAVVGAFLLIALGFGFIGAVMEFVFVESLSRERVSIREYWGQRWRQGGRLFGFRFVVGLITLLISGGTLLAVLWPVLFGDSALSVPLLLGAVALFVGLSVVSGLITGLTTQFVVPIMIAEDRTVLGAWKRFWPTLTGEWKEYLTFLVVQFVLGIAVGIAVGIVTIIATIVVAIPAVMIGIVGAILLSVSGIAGGIVIMIAVAVFLLSVFVIGLFVAVPVQTFLRYYTLLVLGDTNEAFDLVSERRRAIRDESTA